MLIEDMHCTCTVLFIVHILEHDYCQNGLSNNTEEIRMSVQILNIEPLDDGWFFFAISD
jgi:hypothetical protein